MESASGRQWWNSRRLRYNKWLIVSLLTSSALVALVIFIGLRVLTAEPLPLSSSVSGAGLQLIGGLVFLVIANACYSLGPLLERLLRPRNVDKHRRVTYRLGLWLSILLPLVVPLLLGCAVLAIALTGYTKPVSQSDLPGTYCADYGPATETVTIAKDGKFTQTVRVKQTGQVATARGTWRYEPKDKDIYFSEQMMAVIDYRGEVLPDFDKKKDSIVILSVRWLLGNLEIGGDGNPINREGLQIPLTKRHGEMGNREVGDGSR